MISRLTASQWAHTEIAYLQFFGGRNPFGGMGSMGSMGPMGGGHDDFGGGGFSSMFGPGMGGFGGGGPMGGKW